jgi:hypothetical protein
MQLGLFAHAVAVPTLRPDQLAELLMAWDADPNNADLTAKVQAQCGPTDSLRQARDQLALHRREWADSRAAVDVKPASDYPDSPPVVVRGPSEVRMNSKNSEAQKSGATCG